MGGGGGEGQGHSIQMRLNCKLCEKGLKMAVKGRMAGVCVAQVKQVPAPIVGVQLPALQQLHNTCEWGGGTRANNEVRL